MRNTKDSDYTVVFPTQVLVHSLYLGGKYFRRLTIRLCCLAQSCTFLSSEKNVSRPCNVKLEAFIYESKENYEVPKIMKELRKTGDIISKCTISTYMKKLGYLCTVGKSIHNNYQRFRF